MAAVAEYAEDRLVQTYTEHLKQPPLPHPPTFVSVEAERLHRKRQLAATFRLFCRYGFNEGVAGHITVRDPEEPNTFWVNPFGKGFATMRVSDLVRVDENGLLVEGSKPINVAAFTIHGQLHAARPDVIASAHAHTVHGKAFSALGKTLDPITQDSCYFFEDHVVYDCYSLLISDKEESIQMTKMLGNRKALILQNHGLITVGQSIEETAYWMIALDNACHVQLLADAAGKTRLIPENAAREINRTLGKSYYAWLSFQAHYDTILRDEPDFLE